MRPEKTKHAVERLPKWAQQIIERQTASIMQLRRLLLEAQGKFPESRVWARLSYAHGDQPEQRLFLNEQDGVIFSMEQPEHPRNRDVEITFRHCGDYIEVHGGAGISIRPWSGNMVRIQAEPF